VGKEVVDRRLAPRVVALAVRQATAGSVDPRADLDADQAGFPGLEAIDLAVPSCFDNRDAALPAAVEGEQRNGVYVQVEPDALVLCPCRQARRLGGRLAVGRERGAGGPCPLGDAARSL
jgi:hypothetical protein